MKYLILILFAFIFCCAKPNVQNYRQQERLHLQNYADTLKTLYYLINSSDNDSLEKTKLGLIFFNLFPSDFQEFNSLYGFDNQFEERVKSYGLSKYFGKKMIYDSLYGIYSKYGERPLYFQANKQINLFMETNSVSDEVRLRKIIKITKGAKWDADAVSYFQEELQKKVFSNLTLTVKILKESSENEIRSFWYFFFDGPAPINYMEKYKLLHQKCEKIDPFMAKIMQQSFKKVLSKHRD